MAEPPKVWHLSPTHLNRNALQQLSLLTLENAATGSRAAGQDSSGMAEAEQQWRSAVQLPASTVLTSSSSRFQLFNPARAPVQKARSRQDLKLSTSNVFNRQSNASPHQARASVAVLPLRCTCGLFVTERKTAARSLLIFACELTAARQVTDWMVIKRHAQVNPGTLLTRRNQCCEHLQVQAPP